MTGGHDRVWPWVLLSGAWIGAVLMLPVGGSEVADGRVACPNCATYLTLIGWHIRAPSGGVLLVVGALVGLLAGVLLVLAERLIGKH